MDLKKLGAKICASRNARGWSQDELSAQSKVARGALQELEKGRGNPTLGTIDALASALKEPLILLPGDGQSNMADRGQVDPDWAEAARILHALSTVEPLRRFSALYLLTKDEAYLDQIRALPDGLPFAQVLKKIL